MSNPIPFVDLLAAYTENKAAIDDAIHRVLSSGWYILGREVEAFEREFSAWQSVPYSVSVANGTDAIELALRACGIGSGDAVFTVSHTAVATVAAIERTGARPVFVDIDESRFTMCPQSLSATIRKVRDTKQFTPRAVVPVHLYGQPADMPAIIAAADGLVVIEDCAQAHGAKLNGRRVGTFGSLATFSFYPTKNLGALGDGGMVVCQQKEISDRLQALRQYGWRNRYISAEPGINSRLDEIQAAILRVRLGFLDADNARRRAIARQYHDGFGDYKNRIGSPSEAPGAEHVYHLYVIQSDDRESLRQYLTSQKIGTALHYPLPVHLQPAYLGRLAEQGDLPVTERVITRILSLPMYPQLPHESAARVIQTCQDWIATRR